MSKEGCEAVGQAVVGLVRKEDVLSPIYVENYPAKPASTITNYSTKRYKWEYMNQSLVPIIYFLNVTIIFTLFFCPSPWADILCGELMDRIRK